MATAVAAAIGHPPTNAMLAAPGAFVVYLGLMSWWVFFEVFTVIGQAGEIVRFDVMKGVCQRHLAMAMMVPVRFAIGCDVHQLVPLAPVVESAGEALCETLAAGQELFKSHRPRYRRVVEKNGDVASGGQSHQIAPSGIDLAAVDIPPASFANFPDATGLERRKYRELNSTLSQSF